MVKLFDFPVVFVDIETTGVSWQRNKIIELAAVRYEDGQEVDSLSTIIDPGTYLPEYISSITGISSEDLIGKPCFEDVAQDFLNISKDAAFVAHNVRFDYSFIKRQLNELGKSFRPQLICTVRLSRYLYPKQRRHSLEQIIKTHKIKVEARHRALDDVNAMITFCQKASNEHGDRFQDAVKVQLKNRATPPNLQAQLIENLPSACGVYIFEDSEGKPLYVGKSINIKKRVRSHFSSDNKFEKEMKLSLGVHNIKAISTDNELEALLLESKLVKELLPLHNIKLRRQKTNTAIVKNLDAQGYANLSVEQVDLNDCQDLSQIYGLFTSRAKAKDALIEHQRIFSLCSKFLGLEKTKGKCFQAQIGRCPGACAGKESPEKYNLRVDLALQNTRLQAWPYKDSVVVAHKGQQQKGLVVDQWRLIGEVNEHGFVQYANDGNNFFDLDVYKILKSYIRLKKKELVITPFKVVSLAL